MLGLAVATLLGVMVTACGSSRSAPLPAGVAFKIEQGRTDLPTRHIQLEVDNHTRHDLHLARLALTSPRLSGSAVYREPAVVPAGSTIDFVVDMPRADCGRGTQATMTATYALGGQKTRVSQTTPHDNYGSVAQFMARDCAEKTIRDTATLAIDKHFTVSGRGSRSVLHYGISLTPHGGGHPVRIDAVDATVMLQFVSPSVGRIDREITATGGPVRLDLGLRPTRCDPHVIAEDKVGTLLAMHVSAGGHALGSFFLGLTPSQKAQIFDFLASYCGWPAH